MELKKRDLEDHKNGFIRLKTNPLKGCPIASIFEQPRQTGGKTSHTEFEKHAVLCRPDLRSYRSNKEPKSKKIKLDCFPWRGAKPLSSIQPSLPLKSEKHAPGHAWRSNVAEIQSMKSVLRAEENTIPAQTISQPFMQLKHGVPEDTRPDIEDINAGVGKSPFYLTIYANDIYNHLTYLEVKYSVRPEHLSQQKYVTGKMRAHLIDWLFEVSFRCNLLVDTLQMTVGIIDRYLQEVTDLERKKLELVGVTAMLIASKYEGNRLIRAKYLAPITHNAYTVSDIYAWEKKILKQLNFSLGRPSPIYFLRRFIKAARNNKKNYDLAKYLIDLSLVEYSMSHYRPSELAAAGVCLSTFILFNDIELKDTWTSKLCYYSTYSYEHIVPIIKNIATLVYNSKTSRYQAVTRKYSLNSFNSVSLLCQEKIEIIRKIV